jgi:hypothetical protein
MVSVSRYKPSQNPLYGFWRCRAVARFLKGKSKKAKGKGENLPR